MDWQALVIEVRRGRLLVHPLDRARPIWLKVPNCDRTHIENELLRLGRLTREPPDGQSAAVEVLGSTIEPAYIDDRPPRLDAVSEVENQYGFAEYVSFAESEPFERAMEIFRAGHAREARQALLAFIARHPLHIDSYQHLGNLAWDAGHAMRALKYYEMAQKIGGLTLPAGFTGRLPWSVLENRPFLRACHGRALVLMDLGRTIEAAEGLAEILRFNPGDNQGVRYLLPGLLAREGSWERAREVLDRVGPDGTNLYTRCLIDIEGGRRRDAIRWLCAAVSYNPYLPGILAGAAPGDDDPEPSNCVVMGGPSEAVAYLRHHEALWRKGKGEPFLRRVLQISPFARRLARLFEIERALKHPPPGNKRSILVNERFALFGDDAVPSLVAECEAHL